MVVVPCKRPINKFCRHETNLSDPLEKHPRTGPRANNFSGLRPRAPRDPHLIAHFGRAQQSKSEMQMRRAPRAIGTTAAFYPSGISAEASTHQAEWGTNLYHGGPCLPAENGHGARQLNKWLKSTQNRSDSAWQREELPSHRSPPRRTPVLPVKVVLWSYHDVQRETNRHQVRIFPNWLSVVFWFFGVARGHYQKFGRATATS